MPELAVQSSIGRVVLQDVVVGNRLLRLHDSLCQVVVVEQSFPARISGKRKQRVLRPLQVGRRRQCRGSGVHPGVARRSLRGIAKRRLRHQATRVDRPERNARANGRVDSGLKLRLVIDAIQSQAAGEVDERLLLIQLPQHPVRLFAVRRADDRY